ncbi:MAG: peptide chain release factor 2, partial [Clostridium sp.]|nr:peptide chain release factor 2 [Clostridium sp.]
MENKILTGFAVINRAEGKRVAYTHSIIDQEGNIK